MNNFEWIYHKLYGIESAGVLRDLPSPFSTYDVSRGTFVGYEGKEFLIFCSNDYLGMTKNAEVLEELRKSVYTGGSGASRLVSGNFAQHVEFEEFISEVFGLSQTGRSVLLFNSGWAANIGVISSLADEESEIFSDQLNHASIIDGCRLSKAKITVFPHLDLDFLEISLRKSTAKFKLVVVDSIFSMDGDLAPLEDLRYICDKYGAVLYVDEAHAFGVVGKTGRGLQEFLGVQGDVSVYTLSKAVGLYGAFVIAPRKVIDYIRSTARSFIFSTAIPPYICSAAIKSISIILRADELRAKLAENVSILIDGIRQKLGVELKTSSHIIPFIIGGELDALKVYEMLFDRGVFVRAIRYPSVPRGTARLRITVSAVHTKDQIQRFASELFDVMSSINVSRGT
ncbi:MAG: 8-amino-7-oxononanoate synthase [Candidatus Calescibacterium sp.]|nr:8-amino-7-oxononanoate synthase [Candidatus Calescibacterium sp.]MDW8086597.1 8-amino-7-oxononanoate synthase [Candidatus Calescibacterium sp.]